ncbi:MAG TPA: FMN-binding negative transcriptional regulator [Chitinophagaceae bacterium]|nr:FMN-binding negative transcriptional regulator [Chitinophagaceae bacterium]
MYKLKYFTEEDNEKVLALMKDYSFATLTGIGDEYPVATHVPLDIKQVDDKLVFTGHIMKNSDHHKAFLKNGDVLVIFNGPHCHISASWYPNPVQASTWNYMTVHAKGKIRFGDEAYTRQIVEALTNKYENPDSEAAFNKLPTEYIDRLVKAIVAFTIEVESIDNVFKLSQNHEPETRQNIIEHLYRNGSDDEKKIAKEMLKRIDLPKQTK